MWKLYLMYVYWSLWTALSFLYTSSVCSCSIFYADFNDGGKLHGDTPAVGANGAHGKSIPVC